MAEKGKPIVWRRCRGRNGWDVPEDVPEDMGTEALNWSFYEGGLGSKRPGSESVTATGNTGFNALFGGYVPGQDETARELWCVDNAATNLIRRMAAGTSFSTLTLPENINANDTVISFAGLNKKLYLAYNGTVNRLKVFDPDYSTTTVRYAGLPDCAAPTAADALSGTYPATVRYYKVCFTEQRNSVTVRRGELSPSLTFTPSGTGEAARVTRPTAPGEGETHWELYASADNELFYGPINIGLELATSTYDDEENPSTYADNYDPAPIVGENVPMPSVKFLYSNGSRLFGLGVWETSAGDSHTPQAGTVYFTPALDSSDIHDDERCRNTALDGVGRLVLGRNAGGVDRGLGGLGHIVYAFQSKGIYALLPTESPVTPYRRQQISTELGAVSHQSIIAGEDEHGLPCLYFLDPQMGPYRISARGMEWIGKDVKDLWDTFNPGAANVAAHGVFHRAKHQLMFWIATGSSDDPNTVLVCDVTELRPDSEGDLRGGWSKWTGDFASARCSTMMSSSLGATMGRALVPYVGLSSGTTLLRGDTTDQDDAGTAYQAYVQSKAWDIEPLFHNKRVMRGYVLAECATGVTVTQTLIKNFTEESRTATALLTASGTETRTLKQFEATALAEAVVFQVRIGDASATASAFTLDRWYGTVETDGVPR